MFVSLSVSVNIVISHLGRPHSTHTAPMPILTGSIHAHILTKPSRAGFAISRSELIEPGAVTCVFRGMAGLCLKSLEHIYVPGTSASMILYTITFFFFCSGKKSAERSR